MFIEKIKENKVIRSFIVSFVLAAIICTMHVLVNNQCSFRDIYNLLYGQTYYVSNITPINYELNGNSYTSVTDDGILLFPDIDKRVVNVVVNFKESLQKTIPIELYYDVDGSGFYAEHRKCILGYKGETHVEFFLNQDVHTIRVDIGNQSGESFVLKNIGINQINWHETDFYLYFGIIFLICLCMGFRNSTVVKKMYQYRYLVGLACLVICMILGLHGSSINAWGGYLTGYQYYDHYPSEIFGTWRLVRGDEYGLLTPMAFAQAQNDYGYFSDLFGSYGMDVFMVYGQAVKDIVAVFRPFYLGYLLFGVRMGLSFFWCGRFIFLFLVSWDFGKMLLSGFGDFSEKRISFLYALIITMSPVVQWWFAINGLVEMLLFSQLAILLFMKYLQERCFWKRACCIVGICYLACCYIMILYPAWQIPIAWLLVFVAIALLLELIRDKKALWYWKDLFAWGGSLVVFGLLMIRVLVKSRSTIDAVMHSEYPGNQLFCGGADWKGLFNGWANLVLTQVSDQLNAETNICEKSAFLDFIPLGLIMGLVVIGLQIYRKQKKDYLLISLCLFTLIFGSWYVFGWPEMLCKVTLFYMVSSWRGCIAIQLAQVMMLFRAGSQFETYKKPKYIMTILSVLLCVVIYQISIALYPEVYTVLLKILFFAVVVAVCYLILWRRNTVLQDRVFLLICAGLMFSTMLVNPIVSGIGAWKDNQLLQAVAECNKADDVWVADGCSVYMPNLMTTVGAHTINATQVYPDVETWSALDPGGVNEKVYNRYAHVTLDLTSGCTEFELIQNDWFHIAVNMDDLKTLGVTKILSTNVDGYEVYDTDKLSIDRDQVIGDYAIYSVNWK